MQENFHRQIKNQDNIMGVHKNMSFGLSLATAVVTPDLSYTVSYLHKFLINFSGVPFIIIATCNIMTALPQLEYQNPPSNTLSNTLFLLSQSFI